MYNDCRMLAYEEFKRRYIKRNVFYGTHFVYEGCEASQLIAPAYVTIFIVLACLMALRVITSVLNLVHVSNPENAIWLAVGLLILKYYLFYKALKPILYCAYRITYYRNITREERRRKSRI